MIVFPAIDLEGGRVVRGDATADPVTEACALRDAGASWLHVVDVDRVFGRGENGELVRQLAALDGCRVQLGGGLGDAGAVRDALAWGVDRVVIGPRLVDGLGTLPRDRLALNVELRAGRVWLRAPSAPLDLTPAELVARAVDAGVRTVICRDLDRDGALEGADLETCAALVGRGADIIAAGGVAALDELAAARAAGLAGVIVGRALHAGRFTLEEALAWSG